jgi:hypothetical protein
MADLLTSIGDFLGLNKGQATQQAADRNRQQIAGLDQTGTGYLNQALGNSQSLLDLAKSGSNLYADATGVNGADGTAAARAAFTTDPGYQFSQDQGIQALMRTADARGGLGGGQLPIDLANFVTNGANQQYDNWVSRLQPYNSMLQTGTADTNNSLADLLNFKSDIASGNITANNQQAAGQEAGQGGLWNLLGNVGQVAGATIGAATGIKRLGQPTPSFGGYGSY